MQDVQAVVHLCVRVYMLLLPAIDTKIRGHGNRQGSEFSSIVLLCLSL